MKKAIIILAVLILASFLFTSCQKAPAPEGKKEVQTQQEQKEKPAKCQELWSKRPKFSKMDKYYLWTECRIPWADTPGEFANVIQWWKDEDGYEDVMSDNFSYRIKQPSDFFWIRNRIREPLKNIALNSKYHGLRYAAINNLYDMDNRKFITFFKEVIKKEVEERGVTDKNRQVIGILGGYLSEQGEYEYAFPFLMKAWVFEDSIKRVDKRAIPYMYDALQSKDSCIKANAALSLVNVGEHNDKILNEAIGILRESVTNKIEITGCTMRAILTLKKLKDKRAIPILEKIIKDDIHGYEDIEAKKAIDKIMQKGEGR